MVFDNTSIIKVTLAPTVIEKKDIVSPFFTDFPLLAALYAALKIINKSSRVVNIGLA